MMAMNSPIPAVMDSFMDSGMPHIILFLRPDTVIAKNSAPDTKTMASPCSNVNPIPRQTGYARNALTPIPGARATGNLEYSPMRTQAIIAARAVAVNSWLKGYSAAASWRIAGLTART